MAASDDPCGGDAGCTARRRSDRCSRRGPPRRRALGAGALLVALLGAASARADDTIKRPGDHPNYHVEAEPHALLGWGVGYPGSGFGFGGRFSIPIVQNGFIPQINNSVAISFGVDLLFFNECWYSHGNCSATYLNFPVVMQWNFFVAQRWSVFGEPGLLFFHGFVSDCPANVNCPNNPTGSWVEPAIFLGGRYHLSETSSLTMRVGFPAFSFGVSFFP